MLIWTVVCLIATVSLSSTEPVTYGSAIFLQHEPTGFQLLSNNIKWSAQDPGQIVTAMSSSTPFDSSRMWVVLPDYTSIGSPATMYSLEAGPKPATGMTGTPVKCGDTIQLLHVATMKHLFATGGRCHLTNDMTDVVSFSASEVKDLKAQHFKIACPSAGTRVWSYQDKVGLQNLRTETFLKSSSSYKFTQGNCPRCPIIGHLEVGLGKEKSATKQVYNWKALESLTVERPSDDVEAELSTQDARDEL